MLNVEHTSVQFLEFYDFFIPQLGMDELPDIVKDFLPLSFNRLGYGIE